MYRIIFVFLVTLSLPLSIEAADYRMLRITETDTLCLNDQGTWVDCSTIPYTLAPTTVWGNRTPGPCYAFVMGTVYISNNQQHGWEICYSGGDWEAISAPLLTVLVDAALSLGDFISSDTGHKVRAEIEDIELVEQWQGYAQDGHSTSGTLAFDPKTAINPTITIRPVSVSEDVGHVKTLAYIVKAKISDIEEQDAFEQNNLNQLREEYVTVRHTERVPTINKFDQDSPAFTKLRDRPKDVHNHHAHWIVRDVNDKAKALKNAYPGVWFFTSGYRCPVRNRAEGWVRNTNHIYGRAIDFDAGSDDVEANSEKNYRIYEAAGTIGAARRWLYDEDSVKIEVAIPEWPTMADGVEKYTKGHFDW